MKNNIGEGLISKNTVYGGFALKFSLVKGNNIDLALLDQSRAGLGLYGLLGGRSYWPLSDGR